MTHFLYQHKQSHHTNQMKEKEYPENLDSSLRNDIDLQNTVNDCKREYFIWAAIGSSGPLFLWRFPSLFPFSFLSFNLGILFLSHAIDFLEYMCIHQDLIDPVHEMG